MDYLDPRKQLEQRILLLVGYVLVAVAIAIAALILLQQAYGFGLGKDGAVIQNGLIYFSSHPNPANLTVNGKLNQNPTNTRLYLPAGPYHIKLTRDGYRDWTRSIVLEGGSVQHYDYPFLFPKTLATKKLQSYAQAPGLTTQSPDHRWLLVQKSGSQRDYFVHDLKNPEKPPLSITLPDSVVSKANAAEKWLTAEWSDDNQHVLLPHSYDGKIEYIMADRINPDQSLNVSSTLSLDTTLTLNDKKDDQYYSYDPAGESLSSVSLKTPQPTPLLQHVLAYKTYGNDTILFVTDNGAPKGKVQVKLFNNGTTFTVRALTAGSSYVLDLTKYSGVMYVAAGSAADNRVYIYKNPIGQVAGKEGSRPSTTQVLRVEGVNYLSFSANAQFIVAENGTNFGVYDIENENGYRYISADPLDPPQAHASWMDGNRLMYTSNGKLVAFDYDDLNHQILSPASSSYLPAFSPNYKYVYLLAPGLNGQTDLNQTALLIPKDL